MEIMNYKEMLVNAKLVQELTAKTIECSKDYVDSQKTNIIDQMMDYVARLINPILKSNIDIDTAFSRIVVNMDHLMFASFGGDGKGARAQFHFKCNGTYIRCYFNEIGYWYTAKDIDDPGLKYLLDHWEEYKKEWDRGIQCKIDGINATNSRKLQKQLELHEAVKNFKV